MTDCSARRKPQATKTLQLLEVMISERHGKDVRSEIPSQGPPAPGFSLLGFSCALRASETKGKCIQSPTIATWLQM